jgi:hypothetical protein
MKALELLPNAWKAKLRMAEAYALMRDTDSAKCALAEALADAPDASAKAAVLREREKVQLIVKEEASKQKAAFSKMFERKNDDTKDPDNSADKESR